MLRHTLAALALATLPASAQEVAPLVGSEVVDASAAAVDAFAVAIDADGDSRITLEELDAAGRDVFASMDADASGGLSMQEMLD
ncbi:EF-hand domain-containing protein [Jannaschia marina]|uniref:hypothetical protein n=1 Tax=Jannaschia marina TaxID=2741674 RepID=UPI0015CB00AD|nr:hypothetical protein [Jannaschia marina]